MALALNLGLGKLVLLLKLPVYLDMVGTVLLGALCGPGAGALSGALTTLLMTATGNLYTGLFILSGTAVGWLSGVLARLGLFSRPWLAALGGLFTGVVAAGLSAPVSAYLREGVTGAGTDLLVAAFRAAGRSTLEACFLQSLLSDPVDKVVTFALVQLLLAQLPAAMLGRFPAGSWLRGLSGPRLPGMPASAAEGSWSRPSPARRPDLSLYQDQPGALQRRSPTTKLALAAATVLAGFLLPANWSLPALAAGLFAMSLAGGVGLPMARLLSALWLPVVVSLVAVDCWVGPGAGHALELSLRLLLGLEGVGLLLLTTRLDHLGGQLERLGLPPRLVFAGLCGLMLAPSLEQRLAEIAQAQAARGFDPRGSLAARWRAGLALVGPLLLGALAAAEERSLALEARGFGAVRRRTWLEDPPGNGWDRLWQAGLLGACLALTWSAFR